MPTDTHGGRTNALEERIVVTTREPREGDITLHINTINAREGDIITPPQTRISSIWGNYTSRGRLHLATLDERVLTKLQ
jgi:hypothetical protein